MLVSRTKLSCDALEQTQEVIILEQIHTQIQAAGEAAYGVLRILNRPAISLELDDCLGEVAPEQYKHDVHCEHGHGHRRAVGTTPVSKSSFLLLIYSDRRRSPPAGIASRWADTPGELRSSAPPHSLVPIRTMPAEPLLVPLPLLSGVLRELNGPVGPRYGTALAQLRVSPEHVLNQDIPGHIVRNYVLHR